MKLRFIYAIFMAMLLCCIFILAKKSSPEQLIIGEWEEVSWEYEKTDHENGVHVFIDENQKDEIAQNLIIHKAEVWKFTEDKTLVFSKGTAQMEQLKWNMKGRGHILELKHNEIGSENYQIAEINQDTMVMHFNFDLQVRGIVKMTFKRIQKDSYAQKI
ncbi:hypothetical protein [Aequorivita echinoideorum]|uniref:Lipocalin-like domain-containing protein n=1 Tax=Aequorivita echinoideorum TaxID=1549647 RepID=A0ABS5S0X4_9FLAO|nr:hypothetical protein [Aequorivita echinoideorum]MBT0606815.1 hypothetical protein [Aequorivita echinoideorum]